MKIVIQEKINELFANKPKKKLSSDWLYTAVRHVVRNCDLDECNDGDSLSKYDGTIIADILNLLYEECFPPNSVVTPQNCGLTPDNTQKTANK